MPLPPRPIHALVLLAACSPGAGAADTTTTLAPTSVSDSDGESASESSTGADSVASPTSSSTGPTAPMSGETTNSSVSSESGGGSSGVSSDVSSDVSSESTGDGGLWHTPNLWYSVHDALVYIALDPADGTVAALVDNTLMPDTPLQDGHNGLTMLADGSLLGSREAGTGTQIFHIAAPPTTPDTPADVHVLGVVPPDGRMPPLRIEALYTDCDGRVYLMDTGTDVTNSNGNRLLRFTGDYLAGDLAFTVLTDLESASVGDIDDMSPGVAAGMVQDAVGFAIDSGTLWQIDYTTGTGALLAMTGGMYGVHALGGPLFADATPRLYVLSAGDGGVGAALLAIDLDDLTESPPLVVGPELGLMLNGWSGLAGPLTECQTTIPG
jgi:hypothetical protein